MDLDLPSVFLGRSEDVQQVLELARLYAVLAGPLLIIGPTGVGKGLLARLIHGLSGRHGTFVVRTGGQLVESLFQTQLFGSKKGAYSGADRDQPGAFEQAQGGTLFLDELQHWSFAAQSAVLRTVADRVVLPVGGQGELDVTCGMIFAANRPVEVLETEGRLLPDLRHRIGEFVIVIAPLRERRGDVAVYAYHFLDRERAKTPEVTPVLFSAEALGCLLAYEWPGNVREVESVVAFACVHARGAERIEVGHLPLRLRSRGAVGFSELPSGLRRELASWAHERAKGKRAEAAVLLGIRPRVVDYYRRRAS